MNKILVSILICLNIIFILVFFHVYTELHDKKIKVECLEEQVAYLSEHLPAARSTSVGASEATIRSLIAELRKDNIITQYQSGLRLKKIGLPAVPYLLEALKEASNKESRPVLILLESMGDASITPELVAVYKSSHDPLNRVGIINILASWGDNGAHELIRAAAMDKDWRLRAAAAKALLNYKEKEDMTAIVQLLADQNRYVRSAAQSALKNAVLKGGCISALQSIMNEGDSRTRFLLVKHLAKMGGDGATSLLSIAAQDKDGVISEEARNALSSEKR
ncbi:HEAT repeat domain-containing protein [bacterium]|nr:HEAT repeat domain-containing protein [bacterium]